MVLLSIIAARRAPVVPKSEQLEVKPLGHGFYRVVARSGFMETPNVPELLLQARTMGMVCEPSTTSYYLGRETLLTSGSSKMSRWRKALFSFVSRNALLGHQLLRAAARPGGRAGHAGRPLTALRLLTG